MQMLKRLMPRRSAQQFGRMMVRRIVAAGVPADALRYDAEELTVLFGETRIYLGNAYRVYCSQWPWQRGRDVRRFVSAMGELGRPVPAFEEARERLRPGLRDAFLLETLRLQQLASGHEMPRPPHLRFSSRVSLLAYLDSDDGMAMVGERELAAWGKDFDEILAIARANLDVRTVAPPARLAEGIYLVSTGDCYDPGRLLLPRVLAALDVTGDVVAFVPSWHALILTGDGDPALLGAALELAKKTYAEDPRPISMLPLVRRGTSWQDLVLPLGHPAEPLLREMRVRELVEIYGQQKTLLEKANAASGEDVFVASYTGVKRDDGQFSSYCVWSRGVPTLLPEAEEVALVDPERPDQDRLLGRHPFDAVRRACGHLLTPCDDVPARHRVVEFPSADDLARLARPPAETSSSLRR